MGLTVGELLARMSVYEFREWQALDQLDADVRALTSPDAPIRVPYAMAVERVFFPDVKRPPSRRQRVTE